MRDQTQDAIDAARYRSMRAIAMNGGLEASVALSSMDHCRNEAEIDAIVDTLATFAKRAGFQ